MEYLNISIPEGKEPKEYNFVERRAEILRIIVEAGHPKAITQTQLAKRYSKSQAMIHKDIEAIKHEIMECMNQDAEFTIYALFNKVIKKGANSPNLKDNYLAAQAAKAWYEWLQDMGIKKKVAQDINITGLSMEEAIVKFIEKRKGKPKDSGVSEPEKANI